MPTDVMVLSTLFYMCFPCPKFRGDYYVIFWIKTKYNFSWTGGTEFQIMMTKSPVRVSCRMSTKWLQLVFSHIWLLAMLPILPYYLNSLRPSDAIWRQWSWTTLAQVMALLPDGTKPLPEPMLTYHQRGSVAYFWEQFRRNCSRYRFRIWVWKRHFEKYFQIPQGPMS